MLLITTVNDVINWVDSMCQSSQARGNETHEDVVRRIGRQLWHEGHADGLVSGDDWSDWLAAVELNSMSDFADETTSQITPDSVIE